MCTPLIEAPRIRPHTCMRQLLSILLFSPFSSMQESYTRTDNLPVDGPWCDIYSFGRVVVELFLGVDRVTHDKDMTDVSVSYVQLLGVRTSAYSAQYYSSIPLEYAVRASL